MTENNRKSIKSIKNDANSETERSDSEHTQSLYLKHRTEFLLFGNRYGLPDEDILDAYQDAILIYFQKSESGELVLKSSSPKSYLFSIGKHKLIDCIRKKSSHRKLIDKLPVEEYEYLEMYNNELNERQKKLKKAVIALGESCQELLNLFYFKKYSIKNIKEDMGYKSENVVKAQKSRCIKKLKDLLNQGDGTK